MLRCTYIVLIHNNASNIPNLISSLKKIDGNLRKEFIFIDDGSIDESLQILKQFANDLPRTTIITQQTQGPSVSINKALNLTTGDYIHFVEGDEILHPQSTSLLVESSLKLGTQVSVGAVLPKDNTATNNNTQDIRLVETPIQEILANQTTIAREIGKSGSMVHRELIEKIDKADSGIYTHNMSLSLRCAKYSKFAYIMGGVSSSPTSRGGDQCSKFVSYNNLKAIYNFALENPELFAHLTAELLVALNHEVSKYSDKIYYSIQSIIGKYIKTPSLDKVLKLYKKELDRLF